MQLVRHDVPYLALAILRVAGELLQWIGAGALEKVRPKRWLSVPLEEDVQLSVGDVYMIKKAPTHWTHLCTAASPIPPGI